MDIITIAENGGYAFTEKKSEFISRAFFVTDEAGALAALQSVREEHPEARHNVYAYALHDGRKRFSDAGEPSGTAGLPILRTVEMAGVTDVCVVVTRYFGGVLLGASGLTRAYAKSAAGALEASGKARLADVLTFTVRCPYDLHRSVSRLLSDGGVLVADTVFDDAVTLVCRLAADDFAALRKRLDEAFYTKITVTEAGTSSERLTL